MLSLQCGSVQFTWWFGSLQFTDVLSQLGQSQSLVGYGVLVLLTDTPLSSLTHSS